MRWWVPMANAVAGASPEAGVTLSDTGADFLVSFLFNFGLSVCMVGGFMIMRRTLAWFYIPNVVEQQHKRETAASKEPELHDPPGAFGWVWPTWSTSLAWFLRYRGMDAYLYLRFLRSCIVLFTILSLVGIIVLFPTNASGQNRYLSVDNPLYVAGLDVISMANLNSATDINKLWVHAICVLVFSMITMAGIYRQYIAYCRMRYEYNRQDTVYNRSVIVRGVHFTGELANVSTHVKAALLRERLEEHFPGKVATVALPRHDPKLTKMRQREASLVIQLDRAYLKQSKRDEPLTQRTGFLGCTGEHVETLPHLHSQLAELQKEITEEHGRVAPPLAGVAIVTFTTQEAAIECCKLKRLEGRRMQPREVLEKAGQAVEKAGQAVVSVGQAAGKLVTGIAQAATAPLSREKNSASEEEEMTDTAGSQSDEEDDGLSAGESLASPPPPPAAAAVDDLPPDARFEATVSIERGTEYNNIFWEFLHVQKARAAAGLVLSWLILAVLLFFWAIPSALVQGLGNLRELAQQPFFSWLIPVLDFLGPTIESWINAYLPSLLLVLLMSLVVPIIKAVTFREGHSTYAKAHKLVLDRFFAFLVINVFLVSTIAGSLMSQLSALVGGEQTVIELLASTLPAQGSFFVEYIMVKFTFVGMELLRADIFFLVLLRRFFVSSSPDPPRDLNYASRYGWDLLIVVISLTYSVMFPIMSIFAAAYFAFAYFVHRHNFIFIHKPRVHSGGALWSRTFRNTLFGLFTFQLTMIGVLSLVGSPAVVMVTLTFLTTIVLVYRTRKVAKHVREHGVPPPGARLFPVPMVDELLRTQVADSMSEPLIDTTRVYQGYSAPSVDAATDAAAEAAADLAYFAEPVMAPVVAYTPPLLVNSNADPDDPPMLREQAAAARGDDRV